MFGTVIFKSQKGDYFFIRPPGEAEDVFAHFSEFACDREQIQIGAKVEFSLGERKGKMIARDVRPLESARAVLAGGHA